MAAEPGGDSFDVVVIGSGPAGQGAMFAASRAGATVLYVSERSLAPDDVPLSVRGGVTSRGETRVWGLFPDLSVAATEASGTWTVRPKTVIVATGATDRPCPIPGWHLTGTLMVEEACQALISGELLPGTRVAIVSAALDEERALDLDLRLRQAGVTVVARVTPDGVEVVGPELVTALRANGEAIPCDRVILDGGRQARFGLAQMAGCDVRSDTGGFVPVVDRDGQTTIAGLFVVGDAAGPCPEEIARQEGRLAGLAAAGADSGPIEEERAALGRLDPGRARAKISAAPVTPIAPGTVLCRCEGIVTAEVDTAIRAGAASVNDIKRRTRAGMGDCQGALCVSLMVGRLTAAGIGESQVAGIGPMTARPPVRPITVGELAALDPGLAPAPR